MDKTSLAYIKDKAEKGGILAAKIEYCERILQAIENHGIGYVSIYAFSDGVDFKTDNSPLNIKDKDSVDCYGEIALQVIKDLRDRYQAEFDAL
jgi:hypothetical protein